MHLSIMIVEKITGVTRSFVRGLNLGDVIFHYHTQPKAIVGWSVVAEAAFEGRVIWGARGPTASAKGTRPYERPGLWW